MPINILPLIKKYNITELNHLVDEILHEELDFNCAGYGFKVIFFDGARNLERSIKWHANEYALALENDDFKRLQECRIKLFLCLLIVAYNVDLAYIDLVEFNMVYKILEQKNLGYLDNYLKSLKLNKGRNLYIKQYLSKAWNEKLEALSDLNKPLWLIHKIRSLQIHELPRLINWHLKKNPLPSDFESEDERTERIWQELNDNLEKSDLEKSLERCYRNYHLAVKDNDIESANKIFDRLFLMFLVVNTKLKFKHLSCTDVMAIKLLIKSKNWHYLAIYIANIKYVNRANGKVKRLFLFKWDHWLEKINEYNKRRRILEKIKDNSFDYNMLASYKIKRD